MITIDYEQIRAKLAPKPLGSGGQGKVYQLADGTIGENWPVVYKEYLPAFQNQLDAGVLHKMAGLRVELPGPDGQWLYDNTSWPAVVVERQGLPCGFLMRQIPPDFWFTLLSSSQTMAPKPKPANFEFLLNHDNYVASVGLRISERDRLALLAAVAETLDRLHRLHIVVGDLSPKNLLFTLQSWPRCFVIDCDAMRIGDLSVLPQVETPDWTAPTGEQKATEQTDAYKFGLLAIRMMARDQNARDPGVFAAISSDLHRMAALSQDPNPQVRPTPGTWIAELRTMALSATTVIPVPQPAAQPWPAPQGMPQPPGAAGRPGATLTGRTGGAGNGRKITVGIAGIVLLFAVIHAATETSSNPPSYASGTGIYQPNNSDPDAGGGNQDDNSTTDPDQPTASPTPTPNPSAVGSVQIDPAISDDPRAAAVATTLNTYFTAIDDQQYAQALAEVDPSSPGNQGPDSLAQFSQADSSTQDSQIDLSSISPDDQSSAATSAEVTFQSNQNAGQGPGDDPSETCTDWSLTYQLTQDSSGNYLIYTSQGTDSPC